MKIVDGNGSPFLPFTKELRQIAEFLEERGMSAELINATLAARAGLPIPSVVLDSPLNECDKVTPSEFIRIIEKDLLDHTRAEIVEVDFELSLDKRGKLYKKQSIGLHLLFRQMKASKQEYQN